ncbi:HK97 family phage prohead protease [Rhodococcus sp. MEB041]|uniref:HK97 family phage prohead protease n=1 Tax=Rhodococcus sp. MEB041 TaxID=3040323 RepID=UPI00254DF49D|nr:HK97 family phage prohead protease [Rhodococcus sp. MEB041]
MKIKNVPLRVKAGPDDGLGDGEFLVYPSTFTKTPDSYGDVVAPGAFLDTIEEWKASGNTMPGLYGHRLDDPDYFVAGAIDMGEDEHGWWVKGVFDMDSPKGAHVYRLVKGKRLSQLSFAFDTLDEGNVELEDGTKANELRKLKVYEFSFVPIGANQDTSVVAIKALAASISENAKAGRVFSAKNEQALREAAETVIGAARDIQSVLAAALGSDDEEQDDQEQASGSGPAKREEPQRAKREEPSRDPSVDTWAAEIDIIQLEGNSL